MSAKTIYKTLAPFFDAVDGTEEKALKFTAPGYMDLCIEALGYNDHEGRPVYSVAHYGEQNGDLLRDAMIAQREIMRRIPAEYTWSKAEAIAEMQRRVKDFTPEEFEMLDRENRMDWRFVEGEKRYQNRFASTLIATHADLARRQIDLPAQPDSEKERCRRLHEKMAEQGSASARITLKASVGMSDEAFAAALAKAKAEGRDAVHVRAWLPLPAACLSQSDIELEEFTEEPTVIAPENAPQRTVCWEADLTENRSFGVQYIRTQREARDARRSNEEERGRIRVLKMAAGAVLVLLFIYLLYPKLADVFLRARTAPATETQQVGEEEFNHYAPIRVVPNDYEE